MTTTVTIKTADNPVRVVFIDPKTRLKRKDIPNEFVEAKSQKSVVIYDTRAIIVTELKK